MHNSFEKKIKHYRYVLKLVSLNIKEDKLARPSVKCAGGVLKPVQTHCHQLGKLSAALSHVPGKTSLLPTFSSPSELLHCLSSGNK